MVERQETFSDIAMKLCEELGIAYHLGNGTSTMDGIPIGDGFDSELFAEKYNLSIDVEKMDVKDNILYRKVNNSCWSQKETYINDDKKNIYGGFPYRAA